MNNKNNWDNILSSNKNNETIEDNWLDQYLDILESSNYPILDLGCGLGGDIKYLINHNFDVFGLDISNESINYIKENIKSDNIIKLINYDISNTPLPYKDDSFNIIIADLSLHYFDEETTINILNDIKRILTNNGYLIARVNSVDDINYGASNIIDDNRYIIVNGSYKRFFNEEDIIKYFKLLGELKYKKDTTLKYGKIKHVYNVIVKNNK